MLTDVTVTVVGKQLAPEESLGILIVEYPGMPEGTGGAGPVLAVLETVDVGRGPCDSSGVAPDVTLSSVMVSVVIEVTELVEKRVGAV